MRFDEHSYNYGADLRRENMENYAASRTTPAPLSLRQYQRDAVDALWAYYTRPGAGNSLIVAPAGSGKSVICAEIVRKLAAEATGDILIVSHVKKILEQNVAKLRKFLPTHDIGVYSAGLREKRFRRITVAGIQSIFKKDLGKISVLIVDEAHMIPRDGFGMYRTLIANAKAKNPHLVVIGLTATPYRMGTGMLTEGSDALFSDIAYNIEIPRLVNEGYLCPLTTKVPQTQINTDGVAKRGGEFVDADLAKAVIQQDLTSQILLDVKKFCEDRKSLIFFCCSIEHADEVAGRLNDIGISAVSINSKKLEMQNDIDINKFVSQKIRALVNVDMLTTGFDAPAVDAIIMLRPTMSPGLYVQMLGRGTRPSEGKTNCLVLDFAGNALRHGPVDKIDPKAKEKGEGEAPLKVCPGCASAIFCGFRLCPDCGYEFPPPAPEEKLTREAAREVLITGIAKPELEKFYVRETEYLRHVAKSGLPTLKVRYLVDGTSIYEWICLEHTGFAKTKADAWWRQAGGEEPPPSTVDEAIDRNGELHRVSHIEAIKEDRFWKILHRWFDETDATHSEELQRINEFGF